MKKQKSATSRSVKKRQGRHKKHTTSYRKVYWPYIPMLVFLFAVLTFGTIFPISLGSVLGAKSPITTQNLLDDTNRERANHGLGQLSVSAKLNVAAAEKALDMKKRNYWSHKTPENQDPWVFLDRVGYSYARAGENLAYGFSSSESAVAGWMQSQSHRENLLSSSYNEVGFGIVKADNYLNDGPATIVVAFYGSPKMNPTEAVQASITPLSGVNDKKQKQITLISSLTDGQTRWATFIVGISVGITAGFLITRHGIRLKRIVKEGEHFIMHHPTLDLGLTAIIILGILLLQTVGVVG